MVDENVKSEIIDGADTADKEVSESEVTVTEATSIETKATRPQGKLDKYIEEKLPAQSESEMSSDDNAVNDTKYKAVLEENAKFRKRITDNQKFSNTVNNKNKKTLKMIQKYMDDADIDENIAKNLTESLIHDLEIPEQIDPNREWSPWDKYNDVITNELVDTYIDVSDDDEVSNKMEAFKAYIKWLNPEDTRTLIDALDSECKTKMSILKAMLQIGKNYWDTVYKDYKEHGSPDVIVRSLKEENAQLRKENESLKNKRAKREESEGTSWIGEYSTGQKQLADTNKSPWDILNDKLFNK